jgi:hypothetical protein
MNPPPVKPQIGQEATRYVGSDRYACTVIDVTPSGKTVYVQDDTAIRTDNNGQSEYQEYRYERNPAGTFTTFRLTKSGWRTRGQRLFIGERDHYYDYSF